MKTTSYLKKVFVLITLAATSCSERPALYGSPAQLQTSVSEMSFSSVQAGTTERQQFHITNTGDTTAYMKQWPGIEAPFKLLGPTDVASNLNLCEGDLPPHSTCTVVVEFRPDSEGNYTQKFSAHFQNSLEKSTQLHLDIVGESVPVPAAVIALDPGSSWDFGPQFVGSQQNKLIRIENTGNAAAQILTTSFLNTPFTYTGGTFPGTGGNCQTTLTAGDSCLFDVTFAPGVAGNFSTQFLLQYHDSLTNRIKTLNFVGEGQNTLEATLGFSIGTQLHFGFLDLGLNKTLSVDLTNSGTTDATAITVSALSAPFSFAGGSYPGAGGDCGSTLAAGDTCTLSLNFNPLLGGFASDLLTVDYTHAFGFKTLQLGLDGTGSSLVEASLDFSLGTLFDFGSADVNTSQSVTVTVTNTGDLEASFISPAPLDGVLSFLGGAFPGTGGNCGAALGAGSSCTVRISFLPLIGGLVSDVLSMQYHNGTAPATAAMTITGTGIPGGTLDPSFGTAGLAQIGFSADQAVRGIELPSSGKILLAGDAANGGTSDFSLIRLNSNGSIDTGFGTAGQVLTDVSSGSDDWVFSSTMQSNEKVIVAGRSDNRIALARYNTDGSRDTGFNSGGLIPGVNSLLISLSNSAELGYQTAVAANGNITLVGEVFNASNNNSFAAQFTSSGAANILNFGLLGYRTYDLGTNDDGWRAVRIDSGGKLVTTGYRTVGGAKRALVSRTSAAGALDNSFGTGGSYSQDFSGTIADNEVKAMILQNDGKILLAGYVTAGAQTDVLIFRLNTNGTLDTAFGTSGTVTIDVAGGNDSAESIALDASGRILVAANSVISGDASISTVRLNSNGSRDSAFGTAGVSSYHSGGTDVRATAIKIQTDGKILVGGNIETVGGTDALVLRYLP